VTTLTDAAKYVGRASITLSLAVKRLEKKPKRRRVEQTNAGGLGSAAQGKSGPIAEKLKLIPCSLKSDKIACFRKIRLLKIKNFLSETFKIWRFRTALG
jgi:hypothetical protein